MADYVRLWVLLNVAIGFKLTGGRVAQEENGKHQTTKPRSKLIVDLAGLRLAILGFGQLVQEAKKVELPLSSRTFYTRCFSPSTSTCDGCH